jgi:4-alpha-glucanotransferase
VCYTGTHDNDTLIGLISTAKEWDKNNLYNGVTKSLNKLGINKCVNDDKSLANAIIELGLKCKANTFIIPMQDLLFVGSEYRINQPGVINNQNWAVKLNASQFKKSTALKLKKLTEKYGR